MSSVDSTYHAQLSREMRHRRDTFPHNAQYSSAHAFSHLSALHHPASRSIHPSSNQSLGKVVQSSPILPTSAHLKYNIDAVKHYIVNTSDPHLIAYVLLMSTNGAKVNGLKYIQGDPIYFVRGLWHFTVSDVGCDHLNPHVTVVFNGVSLSISMDGLFDGHTLNLKLILIAVSFISLLQLMAMLKEIKLLPNASIAINTLTNHMGDSRGKRKASNNLHNEQLRKKCQVTKFSSDEDFADEHAKSLMPK
ncbi:hypothetical protein F4604DRAFT_1935581 [Suillus subluteus]|nr:hypothetical protein F4604DRAFT_1935581 [Suillus subluteus]